jgi:hypothetical protein
MKKVIEIRPDKRPTCCHENCIETARMHLVIDAGERMHHFPVCGGHSAKIGRLITEWSSETANRRTTNEGRN